MEILEDQRQSALPRVSLSRLADGARGRVGPERLIVSAAVVIAGEAKEARDPKNEKRGRERKETGNQDGLGPNKACGESPQNSGE